MIRLNINNLVAKVTAYLGDDARERFSKTNRNSRNAILPLFISREGRNVVIRFRETCNMHMN